MFSSAVEIFDFSEYKSPANPENAVLRPCLLTLQPKILKSNTQIQQVKDP